MPGYKNLDQCTAFKKLQEKKPVSLKNVLTPARIHEYQAHAGAGLTYNYAAKAVDNDILSFLADLAREQELIEKYRCVLNGEIMNTGENRKVLHHLCRGQLGQDIVCEDKNLRHFYTQQQKRIADFSQKVHKGEMKGSTGKAFDTVVQIGIGGSDLGPRALYLALENLYVPKMNVHFISNVDPDDANAVLARINLETSLFIVVSKSGTTQETITNYHFVIDKARTQNISSFNVHKHIIAVTGQTSPMAKNSDFAASFFIDDFIGGRYSSTSAVGGAVLSLAFGSEIFDQILQGAHEADKQALNEDIRQNAALLDALIGVYERNILHYQCTAVLPYSQALSRFPAHLQQLDMESNGKSVNRQGENVAYATGPVIFGEAGTNGQHSFYQLLHQGTDIIPLQFIGFKDAQISADVQYEGSSSQVKLNANLLAQILAFALGKDDSNPNKNFAGERPSSLIYAQKLDTKTLGALLAHFENKVMFQGFLWNINSFDQEGVQLGKVLTNKILNKQTDDLCNKFMTLLDL